MYRERIIALLVKVETVSGSEEIPTPAANALLPVGVPTIGPGYLEDGNRDDVVMNVLGSAGRAIPAGTFCTIEVTIELAGRGGVYNGATPPESDPMWRAAGLSQFFNGAAGNELFKYTTLDTNLETLTAYAYTAGALWKLVGCVCAPRLSVAANGRGLLQCTLSGRLLSLTSAAMPVGVAFRGSTPPLFTNARTEIDTSHNGYGLWSATTPANDPLMVKSFEVDFGTVVAERPAAGSPTGLVGYVITDRKVRATIVAETPSLATFDPMLQSRQPQGPKVLMAWGDNNYNHVSVALGAMNLEPPSYGGANGIHTITLTGGIRQGTETYTGTGREVAVVFDKGTGP